MLDLVVRSMKPQNQRVKVSPKSIPKHGPSCALCGNIIRMIFQAICVTRTILLLDTRSTKLSTSTLLLYAIIANVRVSLHGTYAGHPGAGDFVGSLTKFAKAAWKVLESVASFRVAVVRLNVPKSSGTIECGALDEPLESWPIVRRTLRAMPCARVREGLVISE
jgi:hypothetical protein